MSWSITNDLWPSNGDGTTDEFRVKLHPISTIGNCAWTAYCVIGPNTSGICGYTLRNCSSYTTGSDDGMSILLMYRTPIRIIFLYPTDFFQTSQSLQNRPKN